MVITEVHISRLIGIESEVRYNQPPPEGEAPFVVVARAGPVLLSAPHGARTRRRSYDEAWHDEDEYTAGMALLLGELCGTPVIAMVARSKEYDPNYKRDVPYKARLRELVRDCGVRYVLDFHGAAAHSRNLAPEQTIDLGYRGDARTERSMDEAHLQAFERLLQVEGAACDPRCFVVGRNRLAGRGSDKHEPVTTFVHGLRSEQHVQALQIEMKPQVRIAHRFATATSYPSCGSYDADPYCVIFMLQALANFIAYLDTTI